MADTTPVKETANVDELLDSVLAKKETAQPEPPTPPPATPSWKDVTLDGDDVPENFKGKPVAELYKSWANAQSLIRETQSQRDRASNELQTLRLRQMAQEEARKLLTQSQPPEAQEDPRYGQLNDLWFSDPPAARALLDQINDERDQKRWSERESRLKTEIQQATVEKENRDRGAWAYNTAVAAIRAKGVPEGMLTRQRVAALYSAITLPSSPDSPNPYFDNGGPLNPSVIEAAWGELYGWPQQAPVAVQPPPVVAPPGSGKPAPAAAPPPQDQGRVSSALRSVMESFADERGFSEERRTKFVDRARKGAA